MIRNKQLQEDKVSTRAFEILCLSVLALITKKLTYKIKGAEKIVFIAYNW